MTFLDLVRTYLDARDRVESWEKLPNRLVWAAYWDDLRAERKALKRLRRSCDQMEALKEKRLHENKYIATEL